MKVYTASKITEFQRWRNLVTEWPEIEFVARWPFKHYGNIPDTSVYARLFWDHDLEDVGKADVILLYANPEDKLRGALVEVGMGLALGKSVIVIGNHDDFSTWQYHRNVYHAEDFVAARLLLKLMGM